MYKHCAEKNIRKKMESTARWRVFNKSEQKHFNITQSQKNDHAEIVKHFKVIVRYYGYIDDFFGACCYNFIYM